MCPIATIGIIVEVTPTDEIQFWPDAKAECIFIEDRTPFRFRVEGELIDEGVFFGLYGKVESGPDRYLNLICNIMLRMDGANWFENSKCMSSFKVWPSISKRVAGYEPSRNGDLPFHLHPEGTTFDGFPRVSRIARVQVVETLELSIPAIKGCEWVD